MGKNLIQQARGKGTPTYKSPGHRFKGRAQHKVVMEKGKEINGRIIDLIHCPGHSCPLAQIKYDDGELVIMPASESIKVGDLVSIGPSAKIKSNNTLELKDIPEGTLIYNIESQPGDGGKFVRSSGNFAKVMSHVKNKVLVQLPSKKQREFNPFCRANIGIVAGSGRTEKPFLKAGKRFHTMKAKNKLYPKVSGAAMNVIDHPFGSSRSSRKSKSRVAPRNAPPGRKVGMIRAKRTGRRKR